MGQWGMQLTEVTSVLQALDDAGVRWWLEGGWGVDALIGRQTRPHRDLDIDIDARQESLALAVLTSLGWTIDTDWRPTRVELARSGKGWVDVHPMYFDAMGDARQAAQDGTFWHIPRGYFGEGRLASRSVGCYTAAAQPQFHLGYELRPQDRLDLEQLDRLDSDAKGANPAGLP